MFCQNCGTKLLQTGKYCHNCGQASSKQESPGPSGSNGGPSTSNAGPSTGNAAAEPLSFQAYRKRKEEDRCSRFKTSKKGATAATCKKAKLAQEVKVQVGLVCESDGNGRLKKVKGRTIPVLFDENDDAETLLQKSMEKHARHHKQFDKDGAYVILYQDMTLVKDLPGSSTPFTLGKYKRDLLKPYSKIYFWLCAREDFENATCDDAEESEDEVELLMCAFSPSEDKNSNHSSLRLQTLMSTETSFVAVAPTKNISVASNDIPSSSHSLLQSDRSGIEKYLVPHQCPTCLLYFPRDDIEAHADICAENWIDPVGECPVTVETNLDEEQEDLENQFFGESSAVAQMENISEILDATKGIVQALKANVKNTSINRITIRRRCAFADYMDARLKKYFKPQGLLKVSFIGEPAIDGGGPRREFFTEALHRIKLRLFDEQGFPLVNMQALAKEEFQVAGEIIASSIVQEGPAPCLFSSNVYGYIVRGIGSVQAYNWTGQLQDDKMKMAIEKMKACKSNDQLRNLLSEESMMDFLELIGYRGIPSKETLHTCDEIIRSLVITGVTKMLAMIDQLISGLESFGVLTEIRKHRELMEPLLTLEGAAHFLLTPDLLLDHLLVEYSSDGSNKKPPEIDVHKFFCDYVQEVATREDGNQNDLSKLYKFITGVQSVTPLGLEKNITIKFKHGCTTGCRCRPTAATCDSSITFPIHFKDSKHFEEVIDGALAESSGFGLV